ncbi:MAG: hypothetical protein ACC647_09385 [Anaerolineales bacterium]
MKLRLTLSFALFSAALILAACGGEDPSPAAQAVDDASGAPVATQAVDDASGAPVATQAVDEAPVDPAPEDTPQDEVASPLVPGGAPTPAGVGFNRRATGTGTAVVDGVPYTFEIYICGKPLGWDDDAYPEDSDETAFYVDPGGEGWEILDVGGVGVQKDGSLFGIEFGKNLYTSTSKAMISRIAPDDPSQSWTYSSFVFYPWRIEFDDGRFKTADGGLGFTNPEDRMRPIRLSFEATCETYGGTFDTSSELAAEVTGIPLPDPGQGSFLLDGERFAFDPETCLVSQGDGRAIVEGQSERYDLSVDLAGEGGPQFVSLSFRDPKRYFRNDDTVWESPLVIQGTRLYAPAPFELTEQYTQETVPFSLDVTCPDVGS